MSLGSEEGGVCVSAGLATSWVTAGAACMKSASQQWEAKRCWMRWRKLRGQRGPGGVQQALTAH